MLVALDLAGGEDFLGALRRCLERGDAIWPVDQRLPAPARQRLFAALAPSAIIDGEGERRLSGGRSVEPDDLLVIATSGTTGEPRGVVLDRKAVIASALATSERLGIDPATDHWLCCLPLSHIGGLSVILRALFTETALTIHHGFVVEAVEEAVRSGVTRISLVPTAMNRLAPQCLAQLRTILLGGSVMPAELPQNAVSTYGLTESGSGVIYDGQPLKNVDVAIASDGGIRLRAPMLLRAYRDGFDPKDAEGWLATGDAGELSKDGVLSVHGRLDELIVSGGENVWPAAVEAVLAGHRALLDVAVVGIADPEWGERVVAVGVVRPGAMPPSLSELRELVAAEIAGFAAPKQFFVLDKLPRTELGKLRRAELVAGLVAP